VLDAAERAFGERGHRAATRTVSLHDLHTGMVLAEDARLVTGTLLVARGYEITASFIERIKNFPPGMFSGEFRVNVP
jgi:hypothetical protein